MDASSGSTSSRGSRNRDKCRARCSAAPTAAASAFASTPRVAFGLSRTNSSTTSHSETSSARKYDSRAARSATSLNPARNAAAGTYARKTLPTLDGDSDSDALSRTRSRASTVNRSKHSSAAGNNGSPGSSGHDPSTSCVARAKDAASASATSGESNARKNISRHVSMSAGVCASGVDLDASRNVCKTSSSTMAAWMVSPETTTSPRLRTHSGKSRESANPRATVRKTLARDSCESSRAVESVARNTTRA